MTTEFYKNQEIFFTGGSGVVGKAAIEKLLRSCDVKKIYILLRCKRGVNPEQRLEDIKRSRIFRVLKECKPYELEKLVAIPGDTVLDGLGISPEHKDLLKNVSVFFHSAATTRFNEPLGIAISANLKSTLEALKLAETFKNLKVFVYVSTFFSNPHVEYIEDKIYPPEFDWRTAIAMLDSTKDENMGSDVIDAITYKLRKGFPNTYVFTKHLSEQLVNDYRDRLPVSIFRPSIVIAAIEEPEPGYTESLTGFMALLVVWGAGLMKVLKADRNVASNCTPLDIGSKLLLIYTAKMGRMPREKFLEAAPVTMLSSSVNFPCPFGHMAEAVTEQLHTNPFEKSLWIPGITLTTCPFVYRTMNLFLELIPALLFDLLLRLFRQKPVLMAIQRKIFSTVDVISFFSCHQFKSSGISYFDEILKSEAGTDFDIRIVLNVYRNGSYSDLLNTVSPQCSGARKFLMNEDESSLPRARKVLKAKKIVYNIIRFYLLYVVLRAIYTRVMPYLSG